MNISKLEDDAKNNENEINKLVETIDLHIKFRNEKLNNIKKIPTEVKDNLKQISQLEYEIKSMYIEYDKISSLCSCLKSLIEYQNKLDNLIMDSREILNIIDHQSEEIKKMSKIIQKKE